ncbi:hypothetical protein PS918_01455 [Pseudomonas fluorescens]|uniref:Uncharacterized protein n=1 Tax=Pseudomonas fluorescens TaxID=294 RepID=A0A5E7RH41_PSEFL|nr:hypothetical protein [Pseudomonas fluorescens]VVP72637.1 hypothetical protein PS918_01455 [Pseudomonas fluorescens]
MNRTTGWMGLLAALSLPAAQAANQEIRALFQPDPSQPRNNVFINQTPNSGYCANYPGECSKHNMFSIQIPVRFNSTRAITPGNGLDLKVPANWRQLTVTHRDTQETETVEVRIIGIGSNFNLSDSAAQLVGVSDILEGHQKLWTGSSWVYAPSPCQYSGVGAYTPATYRFFWKAPVEAACTKVAAYRIPSMYFDTLDFAYELRTPNPLGMSSGLYNGSLTYSLGPGGDFQLGSMLAPDDASLTLDFVLDVQHTLKVDLPPGGSKVVLEPEGGWHSWIANSGRPGRIYRDQAFHLSASSRFKVMMQCNSFSFYGAECKLIGSQIPNPGVTWVLTQMSLPAGITGLDNKPVVNLTLKNNEWLGPFQPGHYVDRKPGNLRFEMPADAIAYVLRPGVNDTFRGDITVIWDSEV